MIYWRFVLMETSSAICWPYCFFRD